MLSEMPGEAIHRARLDRHPSSSRGFYSLVIQTEHLCILSIYLYIHVYVHNYTYVCMYDHISLKNCFPQKGELMINEFLLYPLSLLPPYEVIPGKYCACWLYVPMGKPAEAAITVRGGDMGREGSLHHSQGGRE